MNAKMYRAAAILCFGVIARGATLVVPVSEDTTLFELNPTWNLGGAMLGAGAINQLAAATQAPARMRALMRFDVSGIPAGANITSAQLTVTITRVPTTAEPTGSTFELHRVLKAWGEGAQVGLQGAAAAAGEATWLAPKHPDPGWTALGASDEADASAEISSDVDIDGFGDYTFPSTPALVADVQSWRADPAANFGWMMKSNAEDVRQSARRFASKESPTGKPTLTINYDIPVVALEIQQFELRGEGMFLSWTGGIAPYRVERAESILGPWAAVTEPSSETQATAPSGPPNAFYRVVSGLP